MRVLENIRFSYILLRKNQRIAHVLIFPPIPCEEALRPFPFREKNKILYFRQVLAREGHKKNPKSTQAGNDEIANFGSLMTRGFES